MITRNLDLGIIILNYRTAQLTKDCLDSLSGELDHMDRLRITTDVVVVDNCSGDGSSDEIEQHINDNNYVWATVIRSPVNGGFAAGNNLGIRALDAKAYILLNSDTLVHKGCLQAFWDAMTQHPEAGLIGASFQDGSGKEIAGCFTFPQPLCELPRIADTGLVNKALGNYAMRSYTSATATEPDWVPFAGVLIRNEVLESVGLLDDGFFMYFEDVDFCIRARAYGWKILHWPAARITHLVGGSSQVTTAQGKQQKRAPKYFFEARTRFYAKHYGVGGYLVSNIAWLAGFGIATVRNAIQRKGTPVRDHELQDIWLNAVHPFKASSYLKRKSA